MSPLHPSYGVHATHVALSSLSLIADQSTAVSIWPMVLEGRFRYLAQWTAFLEETHNKPISRDAWTQLLAFVNLTNENPSLEKYDPAGTYRCRPQPTSSLARYFRSLFHYILTLAYTSRLVASGDRLVRRLDAQERSCAQPQHVNARARRRDVPLVCSMMLLYSFPSSTSQLHYNLANSRWRYYNQPTNQSRD